MAVLIETEVYVGFVLLTILSIDFHKVLSTFS